MENLIDDVAGDTSTTSVLELGGTVTGAIDFIGDEDWFAIELTEGEFVRIALQGFNGNLILRDAMGNPLALTQIDFDAGQAFTFLDVQESGTYYVSIDGGFSEQLDYTLSANLIEDFAGDTSTTGVLEVGETITSRIDFEGDSDFFALEIEAGETVRIALSDFDPNFSFFGLVGESGFYQSFGETDINTNESVVFVQAQENVTVFAAVGGFNSIPEDYTLTATSIEDDFTGDISTTGVVDIGGLTTGSSDFTNDTDWFAITITEENTELHFMVDTSQVFFNIVDVNGDIFETSVADRMISFAETGTYYLAADSFNSFLNPVDYTVSTTRVDMMGPAQGSTFIGTSGADTLIGREGDDIFIGGAGGDILDGGEGIDTASYEGSVNRVNVNLLMQTSEGGHANGDSLTNIENVSGSQFADTLVGGRDDNVLFGDGGADRLSGFHGDDHLIGGAGRDTLTGGKGADILDGGADRDIARYAASNEGVDIDLAAGTAFGGDAEGDTLINVEDLFGSRHNDILIGDGENNRIIGSSGDDILDGGAGTDRLFGGTGADTFVFGEGDDLVLVMDFENGVDRIDLSSFGFESLETALESFSQRGDHVRFTHEGDRLLLLNSQLEDLEDFIDIGDSSASAVAVSEGMDLWVDVL